MNRNLRAAAAVVAVALALPARGTGGAEALRPFVGRWKAMMSYAEGGGRFSVGLAEESQVKQIDRNTIAFSIKPVTSATPVLDARLSHDAANGIYLLNVKNGASVIIENLKLSYAEGTGFSGAGTLTDSAGKPHSVGFKIETKADGGHEWTCVDPAAPPNNNIVLGFTFFKRLE